MFDLSWKIEGPDLYDTVGRARAKLNPLWAYCRNFYISLLSRLQLVPCCVLTLVLLYLPNECLPRQLVTCQSEKQVMTISSSPRHRQRSEKN